MISSEIPAFADNWSPRIMTFSGRHH